jgi:predicted lipoprotein
MKAISPRARIWIVLGAIEILLLVCYPPIRVVGLNDARDTAALTAFNPGTFAAQFWDGKLAASLESADDAAVVIEAIRRDRNAAKKAYGRVVGLDGPHHFYIRGVATVVAIDDRAVRLKLVGDESTEPDVVLQTSMIFGNQVLNATGLIGRSQFSRTNDYNEVGAAVNQIVERRVIPALSADLKVGERVEFVGCSDEVSDDSPLPIPMRLIPVAARRH